MRYEIGTAESLAKSLHTTAELYWDVGKLHKMAQSPLYSYLNSIEDAKSPLKDIERRDNRNLYLVFKIERNTTVLIFPYLGNITDSCQLLQSSWI